MAMHVLTIISVRYTSRKAWLIDVQNKYVDKQNNKNLRLRLLPSETIRARCCGVSDAVDDDDDDADDGITDLL